MGLEFSIMYILKDMYQWNKIKIKEPKQNISQTIIKKNKSIDDFMKHHVPWIL